LTVSGNNKYEDIDDPTDSFWKNSNELIHDPTDSFGKNSNELIHDPTDSFGKNSNELIHDPTDSIVHLQRHSLKYDVDQNLESNRSKICEM